MNNAREFTLNIEGAVVDCVSFGKGGKALIMIPGLSDGLNTVKGASGVIYNDRKPFEDDFTVYVFSRREPMPKGFSSRDMARDVVLCMDELNIDVASVMGVSQGGTIAQFVASDYPSRVSHLVLAVTYGCVNDTVKETIGHWRDLAFENNYPDMFVDMMEKIYSEAFLAPKRKYYPTLSKVGVPDSFERFIISATACITHDASAELSKIKCKTLIIGGKEDKVVSTEASYELAEAIEGSELYMYDGLGHGVFDEGENFNDIILSFLLK